MTPAVSSPMVFPEGSGEGVSPTTQTSNRQLPTVVDRASWFASLAMALALGALWEIASGNSVGGLIETPVGIVAAALLPLWIHLLRIEYRQFQRGERCSGFRRSMIAVLSVLLLVVCVSFDRPPYSGTVSTERGRAQFYRIEGQWVIGYTDDETGRTITDPIRTPQGFVQFERRRGRWQAVVPPPASGPSEDESAPRSSSRVEPYQGLSDAEKSLFYQSGASYRQSQEERERERRQSSADPYGGP